MRLVQMTRYLWGVLVLAAWTEVPDHVTRGEVAVVRYVERRLLPEEANVYHLTVAGPNGDEDLACVDRARENTCQLHARVGNEVELWCSADTCTVAATYKER